MAYQVLYRTYRPSKFEEVIGQDYIVKTLQNAIKTDKISHAYLFAGPRGTGKTTVAKLFAKAINCQNYNGEACGNCDSCKEYLTNNHPDIIELDAASNNGVDDIREIVEQVKYAPLIGKYKVYIIDEVHMLTVNAFNALLKTLEEPPSHVIFILATTDPQKVIATVLSRCQRYNFAKIHPFYIQKQLKNVLDKENLKYDEQALEEISRLAEGGMRDGLSILEQCLSYNYEGVFIDDVKKIFGLSTVQERIDLLTKIHNNELSDAIDSTRKMYESGIDIKHLVLDLLGMVKDALIYSNDGSDKLLTYIKAAEAQTLLNECGIANLLNDSKYLEETLNKDKQNQNFLLYFELCLIKMANSINKEVVVKKGIKKNKEIKEEKIPEIKDEVIIEEPVKEEIIEEDNIFELNKPDNNLLLGITLSASKEEKINDEIIYSRLDLYKLEVEKRKFYELLNGTSIFASSPDGIIIRGPVSKIDNINEKDTNEELYNFIIEEFGIDKMVYGIYDDDINQLINDYRKALAEDKKIDYKIERYEIKKPERKEDRIKSIFGDVKVED